MHKNKHYTKISLYGYVFALMIFSSLCARAQQDTTSIVYDTLFYNESKWQADEDIEKSYLEPMAPTDKSEVKKRSIKKEEVEKIRKEDAFWYINKTFQKKEIPQPTESFLSKLNRQKWFQILLWLLVVGGFIVILFWFLSSSQIYLFSKRQRAAEAEKEEFITVSIFDIDYETEIHKAISQKNYRLGIRLLYLQVLKNLSEKGLIQYKQEKTNREYLNQVYQTRYYNEFFKLTRYFEYVWYGKQEVTEGRWQSIQNDFINFRQLLPA